MHREPILEVRKLSKSFPGVKALDRVTFSLERGEVHAVMGENGAGKSTLMKVLLGVHTPDSGEIHLAGKPVHIRSPHDALNLGLAMIHQELLPFPDLTVAENILMGVEPVSRFGGWIDYRALNARAQELLSQLNVSLAPTRKMRELSVSEMQTVEIAKALAHQAQVIIMDEPTSAISSQEVDALFHVIQDLKKRGVSIIYVSHKLDEIFRIADRVTVLRDGHYVTTQPIAEWNEKKLIAAMVGRELGSMQARDFARKGPLALAVKGLGRAGVFRDVSFRLHSGEVLGLAGLMGAGRTEVVNAIYGLAPADEGEIWVREKFTPIKSPREAIAHGIALVSEDRRSLGLSLKMSLQQNVTLTTLAQYCRAGFINVSLEKRIAEEQIRTFAIKAAGKKQRVSNLSGGNQQKVVLAKALLAKPEILLLDEPTRGIDVGAKAEIYKLIAGLAKAGKAILLVSSELPEILSLSDRILVMREGRVAAELDPTRTAQEEIMKFAMPAGKEH